jgi:hypothetical protein
MISSDPQAKGWPSLFEPDGKGPWAVRYNWIKHTSNQEFLDNYFEQGSSALKLNLRNMTKDQAHLWKPHNDALAKAEITGRMVWRIKVLNEANQSIDHLEVWRSREDIEEVFHTDYPEWTDAVKEQLGRMTVERGFVICPLQRPYPLISKLQALRIYSGYIQQVQRRGKVRIETPMRFAP